MKTIAWDVDDTLNNFTQIWFNDWWLLGKKNITLQYSQINANPPGPLLGIDDAEYLASLDSFRTSETACKIRPTYQVLQWFQNHGYKARHLALTATPLIAAPYSAFWVMTHFGDWIRSYNVVPSVRTNKKAHLYDQSKIEFLEWFGKVDVLVEDNGTTIEAAESAGYLAIGIPQPWNNIRGSVDDALYKLTSYIEG